ncbi:MAG: glycosyltransferase [Anaerolineales bacterium]|nr:glycosyltransferase [Anaerolineales bacterium]
MPKASIIILTYNNLDITRLCIEGILEKTSYPDYEVIFVDNASRDGTPAYLTGLAEAHDNVRVLLNQENVGFAQGNNLGAEAAQGEILVFLNNDTVVTPGWLGGLAGHLEDPAIGMAGPVTNASGNQSRIPVTYESLEGLDAFAEAYTRAHEGSVFDIPMLAFHCVALRREVFEEIGPLDTRFGRGMFEDDDYAMRLHAKGYRIVCAEDVFIHHWGSASFSQIDTNEYWKLFKHNLELFEAKWATQWQPHQYRQELLAEQLRGMFEASIWLSSLLAEQQERADYLQNEIDNIYSSNVWSLSQRMVRWRFRLAPPGSRRADFFSGLLRMALGRGLREPSAPGANAGSGSSAPLHFTPPAAAPPKLSVWPAAREVRPLVSVILPVYNHADILEAAARSVLDNTYRNIELVVLDDGSTDDITPVLRRLLADPRVRIYRQPNQKLPRALTHAHRLVRGDFITWTSSDNLMAPEAIEALVVGLQRNPQAVLAYADVALIDADGRFLTDRSYRPQNLDPDRPEVVRLPRDTASLGLELDNFINACFLYRRSAARVLDGCYADDLNGYEDYDFWLRLQKCGELVHIRNKEPLYFYRVHERAMSHDLLTKDRQAHLERGRQLIEYEAKRRASAGQPWSLDPDPAIDGQIFSDRGLAGGGKRLPIVPAGESSEQAVFARRLPGYWELVWRNQISLEQECLQLWAGAEVNPLAKKARFVRPGGWEFPEAAGRKVVGCHLGPDPLPIDWEATRRMLAANPGLYFAFLSAPDSPQMERSEALCRDLDNAHYLGDMPFGEPYAHYAAIEAFWIPPLDGDLDEPAYRRQLALAYAARRPLFAPRGSTPAANAPYQLFYFPGEALISLLGSSSEVMELEILDRYLAAWTPAARFDLLLRYAHAAAQELGLTRPKFSDTAPLPDTAPTRWPELDSAEDRTPFKCALVVSALDRGGLEEMVAQLATRLPEHSLDAFVLCVNSGGLVAERLKRSGVGVYIAQGQEALIREILLREKPDLINTHFADEAFVRIAGEAGVPVVESIQNTYVWYSPEDWEAEARRSRHFRHAVAVSRLVKDFYLRRNLSFKADWVSVGPNAIDPDRLQAPERQEARDLLGIAPADVLFLVLAGFDGRKNQLATLAAFEAIARSRPEARLMLVGHIADQGYYQAIQTRWEASPARRQITIEEYREDTGLLLAAADALVLNSFFEGWSLAATEALMVGTPLIHSDCGSGRELVGDDGRRGILIPNPGGDPLSLTWEIVRDEIYRDPQRNREQLMAAMRQVVEAQAAWTSAREEIQAYARDNFGVRQMIENYSRVFRAVRHGRRPGETDD